MKSNTVNMWMVRTDGSCSGVTRQIPRPHHAGSIFKHRHSQFASNQGDQIVPDRKLNAHSTHLKKKTKQKKTTQHIYRADSQ